MATVLITDDAASIRLLLKATLTKLGHDVVGEAEDGREAIKKYKELKPDLVTMDVTMPSMDGISAMKVILNFDPKAKVIICSAMGQKELVKEAILSGAKDFIVKPFDELRMKQAIDKLFNHSI